MSENAVFDAASTMEETMKKTSVSDVAAAAALYTVLGVGLYVIAKKAGETVYRARKYRKSNKK